jgi:hypothetical protein
MCLPRFFKILTHDNSPPNQDWTEPARPFNQTKQSNNVNKSPIQINPVLNIPLQEFKQTMPIIAVI